MRTKLLLYSVVFLLIAGSGSLFVKTIGDDYFYIFVLALTSVIFVFRKNSALASARINYRYLLLLFLLFLVHYSYHNSGLFSYAGLMIRMTSVLLVALVFDYRSFWRAYVNIIAAISLASLFGFVIINFFQTMIPSFAYKLMLNDVNFNSIIEYNNLFIITWRPVNYYWIIRNQAIFWEPGAFQFFVNLALIWNNYFNDKNQNKFNILFSITVLSTFSTLGYIVFAVVIFTIWGPKFKKNIIVSSAAIVALIILLMTPVVIGKFSSDSLQYSSYQQRLYDSLIDFEIAKEYLFTGYGIGSEALAKWANYKSNITFITGYSSSNNLLMYLGQFGIILFGVYFYPLFKSRTPVSKVLFISIIFMVLAGENFAISYIMLCLLYIGKANNVVKHLGKSGGMVKC